MVVRYKLFINGEFSEPHSGEYKVKTSPIDNSPLAEIAVGDREDAKRAIDSAYEASFLKYELKERGYSEHY